MIVDITPDGCPERPLHALRIAVPDMIVDGGCSKFQKRRDRGCAFTGVHDVEMAIDARHRFAQQRYQRQTGRQHAFMMIAGTAKPAFQQPTRHDEAEMIVIRRSSGQRLRHIDEIEVAGACCLARSATRHALSADVELQEKTIHAVAGDLMARTVEILRERLGAAKRDIADESGIDTGEETVILRSPQAGIEQHIDRIPPQRHGVAFQHLARIKA